MERRQLQVMQWHAYWMRPAKAEALLRGGGWLAKQYDARLAIIHVVAPASAILDYVVYGRDVVTSANVRMRELKGRQGIYAPHRVAGGMIAALVQEEAQRQVDLDCDWAGASQDGFAGIWSSLYEIIREAPCPVLSI